MYISTLCTLFIYSFSLQRFLWFYAVQQSAATFIFMCIQLRASGYIKILLVRILNAPVPVLSWVELSTFGSQNPTDDLLLLLLAHGRKREQNVLFRSYLALEVRMYCIVIYWLHVAAGPAYNVYPDPVLTVRKYIHTHWILITLCLVALTAIADFIRQCRRRCCCCCCFVAVSARFTMYITILLGVVVVAVAAAATGALGLLRMR